MRLPFLRPQVSHLRLLILAVADHCDQRCTDGAVHLRKDAWYRTRLLRHFRACGGGVFLHKDAAPVLFTLETV